jgi:membrane-associated protease RseP (regulator of RpoE activity)
MAFTAFAISAAIVFTIHEMGHYIVAVLCRVRVESVTIGFGRQIWAKTDSGGTLWSVRSLPVCGLVRLYEKSGDSRSFELQKLWKRILIVVAGPVANLLLAFIVLMLFFTAVGRPVAPPIVTGVNIGAPADKAGFQPGDEILSMDGRRVVGFSDVYHALEGKESIRPQVFSLRRDGKILDLKVTPEWASYTDLGGFAREHGRTGILVQHIPFLLVGIWSVNGLDTYEKPGLARELLLKNMDRTVVVGLEGDDGKVYPFRIRPRAELNKGLSDPDSKDYDRVFFSTLKNNIYLIEKPYYAFSAALFETKRLSSGLLQLLGRASHIDRSLLYAEEVVRRSAAPVKFFLFDRVHKLAWLSLCIAFINLLPMPFTDGSHLVVLLSEMFVGRERIKVVGPYVQRFTVLVIVSLLLFLNMPALAILLR